MTRISFLFICLAALFWLIGVGIAGEAGGLYIAGICATISAWRMWSEKDRVINRSGAVRLEYFQVPNLIGMVRASPHAPIFRHPMST